MLPANTVVARRLLDRPRLAGHRRLIDAPTRRATTTPSTGTRSPGRTMTTSPTATSPTGDRRRSRRRAARARRPAPASSASESRAGRASMLRASSHCAMPKSQTTVAASSQSPSSDGAGDRDHHQHVDVERAARGATATRAAAGARDRTARSPRRRRHERWRAATPAPASDDAGARCASRRATTQPGDAAPSPERRCWRRGRRRERASRRRCRSRRRSRVRLLDVLAGVVQQADDVVVVERVERDAAGAAHAHEPRGAQQTQLVRDGRFGQADERRQIADAALAVASARRRSRTRVGSPSSLKTSATARPCAQPAGAPVIGSSVAGSAAWRSAQREVDGRNRRLGWRCW